ncbi:PAQR family membrane homeostasis protein TrhA [Spirochaeta cellobiosiphila]|uniref:PAQR family membrane homeostasis protein TrhA n=1 Tax=Spirochaeta cellobiosiphila TaxID=504483 RepID=UPI00048C72C0|nr:hemolysin III family protein [Spirochaeta cellobiosiphila]
MEQETWLHKHITLHSYDNRKEDLVSAWSHAIGMVFGLVALILLAKKGYHTGDTGTALGYILYGFTIIILFTSSTLYHFFEPSDRKRLMRIFDHMSIYLMIAGTYTPITIAMGGVWGWSIFATIWTLAFLGMILKILFWGKFGIFHVLFYIAMGWLVVIGWNQVASHVHPRFLTYAMAGGITYTLGTIVYAMKKIPYYHGIWHLFVLGGNICFFLGIYYYI